MPDIRDQIMRYLLSNKPDGAQIVSAGSKKIADYLGVSEAEVLRAIPDLHENNFVLQKPAEGESKCTVGLVNTIDPGRDSFLNAGGYTKLVRLQQKNTGSADSSN